MLNHPVAQWQLVVNVQVLLLLGPYFGMSQYCWSGSLGEHKENKIKELWLSTKAL